MRLASCHKHARRADATGELREKDPGMIALHVLSKTTVLWWVIARQNTSIPR